MLECCDMGFNKNGSIIVFLYFQIGSLNGSFDNIQDLCLDFYF